MGTSGRDEPDADSAVGRIGLMSETKPKTRVINHLTGKRVSVRSIIDSILNTQRLNILHIVREQPITVSALQEHYSITRPTATKYLSGFADLGLVYQQSDKAYAITGGGAIALRILTEQLDRTDIDQDKLAEVARSSAKLSLLRAFAKNSSQSTTIEAFDSAFSRSTRTTHRRSFEKEGWITREGGSYHLTPTGESVLDAYEELERSFEQLIDKAPCLRDLGPECEGLPVAELADAEQIIGRIGSPSLEGVRKYDRLIRSDFEYCRGLSSYYEAGYSRAYASAVEAGKEIEVVMTPKVLRELPFGKPTEWEPIKTQALSENCHGYLYPGSLPLGLAVFDEDIAVLGAPDPAEIELDEYGVTGTIFTENEAVIEWGIDLFESYRRLSISEPEMNSTADIISAVRSHLQDLDIDIELGNWS